MTDRIGGVLVLLGSAFALVAIAAAIIGLAVGLGRTDPAGLAVDAAVGSVGLGEVLLGIAGRPPLDGRVTRVGLVGLGIGLLSIGGSAVLAGASTTDPLESLPIVALTVSGFCLVPIGSAVVGASLLIDGHRSRPVGALLVVGIAMVPLAAVANGWGTLGGMIMAAAFVLITLGTAGIGLLALTSEGGPR